MNERVPPDTNVHEGRASPWPSGVGVRRVRFRTPGLRLGLILVVAGLLWYGSWLAEHGGDLPRHAWARIETRGQLIAGLAWTSDGARLVSADYFDGTIRTWDAASGRSMASIDSGPSQVYVFAFAPAPDYRTAAVGISCRGIALADLDTGGLTLRVPQSSWDAVALVYAPDGRTLVTAGSDRMIRAHDTVTWRQRWSCPVPESVVHCLAVAPDGRSLIGGGACGRLRCWDLDSGRLVATLHADSVGTLSVACAPDGRTLASGGSDGRIRLWDMATLRERLRLGRSEHGLILRVAYSPDGRLLATGHSDQVVRIWDPATGELLRSLPGHRHAICSLAFAPHGRTLASGAHATILLWDLVGLPAG
jgi:WD40 repeat protein